MRKMSDGILSSDDSDEELTEWTFETEDGEELGTIELNGQPIKKIREIYAEYPQIDTHETLVCRSDEWDVRLHNMPGERWTQTPIDVKSQFAEYGSDDWRLEIGEDTFVLFQGDVPVYSDGEIVFYYQQTPRRSTHRSMEISQNLKEFVSDYAELREEMSEAFEENEELGKWNEHLRPSINIDPEEYRLADHEIEIGQVIVQQFEEVDRPVWVEQFASMCIEDT